MTEHFCDANVWLALALEPHRHREVAQAWFETVEPPASILFCRATQQSLLRLLTTSAVLAPYGLLPLTNHAAWAVYDVLLADSRICWVDEPEGLEAWWKQFAARPSSSPKLWMDAYLAAFARAGGYQMVTTDAAFRQFGGLDLIVLGGDQAST